MKSAFQLFVALTMLLASTLALGAQRARTGIIPAWHPQEPGMRYNPGSGALRWHPGTPTVKSADSPSTNRVPVRPAPSPTQRALKVYGAHGRRR
jgi:hypothetical protein